MFTHLYAVCWRNEFNGSAIRCVCARACDVHFYCVGLFNNFHPFHRWASMHSFSMDTSNRDPKENCVRASYLEIKWEIDHTKGNQTKIWSKLLSNTTKKQILNTFILERSIDSLTRCEVRKFLRIVDSCHQLTRFWAGSLHENFCLFWKIFWPHVSNEQIKKKHNRVKFSWKMNRAHVFVIDLCQRIHRKWHRMCCFKFFNLKFDIYSLVKIKQLACSLCRVLFS